MYKIMIADDHPLIREAISNLVQSTISPCTVLHAESLSDAKTQAQNHDDLDLILLDLHMPDMHGLDGLNQLRHQHPLIPVAILSAEKDKSIMLQAVTAGAIGFINKAQPRDQLCAALRQLLDGQIYLPSEIIQETAPAAADSNSTQPAPEILASLTRKQLLVLERLALGEANKQIAHHLNIAETTVKVHVSAILKKLGVRNRIQAVLSAGNIDFNYYLQR